SQGGHGAGRPASVRRRHVRRGDLLLPAALRGRPGSHDRRDGPLPAPRRHAGLSGVPRPAAAGLAGRLVVLHPARAARAGRPHRRPRLVPGGPVPRPEHLRALPAAPARLARRRVAGGGPDRRRHRGDEPRRRAGHVGAQGTCLMRASGERSAFYAVGRGTGGLGDWVTLLHPPYTLWHLSYVATVALVVPALVLWRLAGTLLAFFLAVGIGAHALDELHGRPLGTGISRGLLTAAAVASITAAMVLGLVYGGWKLLPFVIAGGGLGEAPNPELFRHLLPHA